MPFITVKVGPRNAYTDAESGMRFYRWQGRDLPSVTTIRRMAGLPHGLHQWSIGKVIDYALDHQGDFRERLKDPAQLKVIRHELRKAATAERDLAAELGTAVHDAAATGKGIAEVRSDVAARLRQYLDWLTVSRAEILGAEFQVWNLTAGYAGTVDLLVRFPDSSIWVVDIKTGKGVYAEHSLQLMGYLMAEFVGADDVVDDELTACLREARGMAVLHLADDHWDFRALRADSATWASFRGLLAFSTWMAEHADADSITTARKAGGS